MHLLTRLCLKKPVSTFIIIVAMVIFSIASVVGMNMQLTPDMEMPYIIAMVVYSGASPDQVDRLVAQELEEVGATITGLSTVQSQSMENMCYMIYGFDYGTDVDKAYNDLQQEINQKVSSLPDDCKTPTLIVLDINAMESMSLAVTSKTGADVRGFVNSFLEPDISSVENVARVDVNGGREDYISVRLDPEALAQYSVDMTAITGAISSADFSIPGGAVDVGSQSLNVNSQVSVADIYDLEDLPITTGKGETIRIKDVGRVSYAQKKASSLSYYNGSENVSIDITKQQGSNAVGLSRDIKALLKEYEEKHPDFDIEITYDSADQIVSALTSVGKTLVIGVVLSMIVLFIFFGDIKASLIVGSSMPVSLMVTILLMYVSGYSLSVITLGGMVIGIGMMVDNSIVVLEMCFQKKDKGFSFEEAAYDAVITVSTSIFASTLTTVVVYLPLALMKGLSGQMFGPLGFTIIYSLTSSLISAVTLVPLCYAKYHPIEKKDMPVSKWVRATADRYGKILNKVLNKKATVIIVTVVMVAVTILIATQIHSELMSSTDSGMVTITANVRPGLSLDKKNEMLEMLEDFVKDKEVVEKYTARISDGSSTLTVNAYFHEDEKTPSDEVADEWNKALAGTPNMEIVCKASGQDSMSGGGGGDKSITMQSKSLASLREASDLVADNIRNIEGVINVKTAFSDSAAKAEVRIDPVKAAAMGISPAQAGTVMRNAQKGSDVMTMTVNEKDYSVIVEYPEDRYTTVDDLMGLKLMSTKGKQVALGDIAEVVYSDSPQTISRTQKSYEASVTCTLDSKVKFDTQEAIDNKVKELNLPPNVFMAESSYDKMMREEFTAIIEAVLAALWLVFMVMTMQFESARYALMIMFCIPFSLIGSFLLLFLTGSTLSMTSLMGFLMLEGIVVNNGILMVDTTNLFRQSMSTEIALVEAGKSRLRPILMTTLTTILSMLPLALGIGKNTESMQSMAVVIVGGLIASTILTLILLPTFYIIIAKRTKTDKKTKKRFFKGRGKPIKVQREEEPEPRDEGVDN